MKHNLLDAKIKSMIIALRKKGRTEDKKYLVELSDLLDTGRRRRAKVNVFKLDLLAKRHKDKVFVVPGTILGYGELSLPINVYAFKYSKAAVDKIKLAKGSAKSFDELLKSDVARKDVMILK